MLDGVRALIDGTLLDPRGWYPPPQRPIFPMPWLLVLYTGSFIALLMLPRRARIKIAAPILLILASQFRAVSTGDEITDFLNATVVFGFILKFIDFGLLVQDGNRMIVRDRRGIWQRLKDSVELLLLTTRGIGWNWEVRGIPNQNLQSNQYFLFRTMLRIVGTFIAWDICKHIMGIYAYIKEPDRTPFFDQPILDQVVLTWLHQLEAFCVINLPYQIGAYLTVAPGFQERSDWPPLFGNTSDAYLVSKAWGRTWHQLLRRSLGVFTPYVQNWLGATSRKSKRTVSLLCSFSMSGLIHWSGALNNPWTPTSHGLFTYFIMQAPVIRIEDYVIDWGKARGFKGNLLLRTVGYVWTFAWISFSMRYAAAYQFESGALKRHEPFKFSIIDLALIRRKL